MSHFGLLKCYTIHTVILIQRKLRYLIAAALAAGSMAVCAGAVRTVTPQEALQSSIAQVQQQWQNENDKSMYFTDGDG